MTNKKIFLKIKKKFINSKTKILEDFNKKKLIKSDVVVSSIPGLAGLEPTLRMIKISKKILIANKEAIICGWDLIKQSAKKNKTKIIPIDSEHFSILKLLEEHRIKDISFLFESSSTSHD